MWPRTSSRPRGATLIELLVYTALFGLIMTLIYSVFTLSMTYYTRTANSIEAQQRAQVAANRVFQALLHAAEGSARTDGTGIVFASADQLGGNSGKPYLHTSSGELLWQKYVCIYTGTSNGRPALLMKEKTLTGGATATKPDAASLPTPTSVAADNSLTPIVLSTGITAASFTAGSTITYTLTSTKTGTSPKTGGNTNNTVTITSQVDLSQ